jgi:hypothetical protein
VAYLKEKRPNLSFDIKFLMIFLDVSMDNFLF